MSVTHSVGATPCFFKTLLINSTTASAKAGLRAIARRWLALDEEIRGHDVHIEALTAARAPAMVAAHGMGAGTTAELLLVVGEDPARIRSEGAFAKLCGACPIPASSGKTNVSLRRGPPCGLGRWG